MFTGFRFGNDYWLVICCYFKIKSLILGCRSDKTSNFKTVPLETVTVTQIFLHLLDPNTVVFRILFTLNMGMNVMVILAFNDLVEQHTSFMTLKTNIWCTSLNLCRIFTTFPTYIWLNVHQKVTPQSDTFGSS